MAYVGRQIVGVGDVSIAGLQPDGTVLVQIVDLTGQVRCDTRIPKDDVPKIVQVRKYRKGSRIDYVYADGHFEVGQSTYVKHLTHEIAFVAGLGGFPNAYISLCGIPYLRDSDPRIVEGEGEGYQYQAAADDERLCVVCHDNERTHLVAPCGHKAYCRECIEHCNECALCRAKVTLRIRVFD